MRILAALLVLGLGSAMVQADEVRLKNGNTLVGLAREEASQIVLEVPSGTITLWKSDVESIVPGRTTLHEYHEKLKAIDGSKDAGDYYSLAVWCRDHALPGYVGRLLKKAGALDPDHKEAREMLQALAESDAAPLQAKGAGANVPAAPPPSSKASSDKPAPRMVEVPTLYMGVSPYRDDHSRYRSYSRYRSRGGRWYGPRVFGGGHMHLHGSGHGGAHAGGHH